jgi:predicted nucleic acid-binding protein
MTRAAIDTNVLVYLWSSDEQVSVPAREALEYAYARGALVITGVVHAELLAAPGRDREFIDRFLSETGITVDWSIDEPIWRLAGESFSVYAERRRRSGDGAPRRILADFVIGAHAVLRASVLLTGDDRFYRTTFPSIAVKRV